MEFWTNLTTSKKIALVVALVLLLALAAYFLFFKEDSTKAKEMKIQSDKPAPQFVSSSTGGINVADPNINPSTVPPPRTPVSSNDAAMAELIRNMAISLASDPARAGQIKAEKSIPLNAFQGLEPQVKTMMETMLENLLGIDAQQARNYPFLSSEYSPQGGVDFKRELQAAAKKLKGGDFNIKLTAWGIMPLVAGANVGNTKSFEKEAKVFKMQGLTGAKAAQFFDNLLAEEARFNREIKNKVIAELRAQGYRFSDYGDQ